MATLKSTTATNVTGNISSPKTFITSTDALQEWSGSVYLDHTASVDVIGHNSYGYVWQIGTVCFTGVMDSMSWTFSYADYCMSLYGLSTNEQLVSDWGQWSFTRYSATPDLNYLRFTNNCGSGGTFYFTVRCSSFTNNISSILTRIK